MTLREVIRERTPPAAVQLIAQARHKSLVVRLRGDTVECPACGGRFSGFLPDAAGNRVVCPQCSSMERHRRMVLFLRRQPDIRKGGLRILHVAPERSIRRELEALPGLDYVSADLYAPDVDLRMDVTDIHFKDGTFDLVICAHVLEHVADDSAAMRELCRVLKPTGYALGDVPCDATLPAIYEDPRITGPAERLVHFGQEDHVRLYDVDGFVSRMVAAGFDVTENPLRPTPEEAERYVLGVAPSAPERSFLCRPARTR